MFGKTFSLGLVSLLSLALPSVNAFATTGCYAAGEVSAILGAALTFRTTGIESPSQCVATCSNLDRDFAYFDGNIDTCYCTDVTPLLTTVSTSLSTIIGGVDETVCTPGDLQGLDVNTPYTDFGCASPADTTATSPVSGGLLTVLSISDCLSACNTRGYRFAFITNLAVSLCQCASNVEISETDVCGLGRNYVYVNLNVSPSGVARKRMLEARKRSEKVGLCPTGLSACRVDQGEFALDAFECLDVKAELESCGGCTSGILDGDANLATSGVDCSAIPGVEMGAVSCMSGKCRVSKCKSGYTLVDNTCVSTRSVAAMGLGTLRMQNI